MDCLSGRKRRTGWVPAGGLPAAWARLQTLTSVQLSGNRISGGSPGYQGLGLIYRTLQFKGVTTSSSWSSVFFGVIVVVNSCVCVQCLCDRARVNRSA